MGKSKGGKYFKPPRNRAKGAAHDDEGSEEEDFEQRRGLGGQASNVGMLPPSDSEDEGTEKEGKPEEKKPEEKKPVEKKQGGQAPTAGLLPPNSSDEEEEESEEEDSDSDDGPVNEYLNAPRTKRQPQAEERSTEQVRKDMERLEMIRQKREEDRKKRIATEGWDRFAAISETNRPPGYMPSDHPDAAKK